MVMPTNQVLGPLSIPSSATGFTQKAFLRVHAGLLQWPRAAFRGRVQVALAQIATQLGFLRLRMGCLHVVGHTLRVMAQLSVFKSTGAFAVCFFAAIRNGDVT